MTLASLALLVGFQGPIQIPFRMADNAIVVDASINGKKASFMFDTGFSGAVVLDNSINIGPSTGTMTLRDFVGELQANTVKIKTLVMSGTDVHREGMQAVQQPLSGMSFGYNTHVDGIMGFEVIRDYVTEINFEKSMFILHPKTVDITKRTPDNARTFLAKMLPTGHNSIEMQAVTPSGKKMNLALDTGNAFYGTTHKDVLERVGLWEAGREPKFMKLSGVASGTVESFYMRMKNVSIFGVPVAESIWSIIDLPSSSADGDGTIGFGFLKHFNIVIDYDRRRVWLDNFSGKVTDAESGSLGISATTNERTNRVQIVRVAPSSPAAEAGIKERDEILSVDGKELVKATYRQVESLLEGVAGSKVKLAVSRAGVLMRYELERKALVND
jgi:predicted aspartyl protease